MPPHSPNDANSYRHERCSAQNQEHIQNLDHHGLPEYQMKAVNSLRTSACAGIVPSLISNGELKRKHLLLGGEFSRHRSFHVFCGMRQGSGQVDQLAVR